MHGYHVQQPKQKKSVASWSQTVAIPAPFSYKPAKLTIPPVHRFLLHHQLFLSLPTNSVADQSKPSYTYSKGLHRRTCCLPCQAPMQTNSCSFKPPLAPSHKHVPSPGLLILHLHPKNAPRANRRL